MGKIEKENIEDILALTPLQEGILFHYRNEPNHNRYFEQLSLGIAGDIDKSIFEKAWNLVVETNEMLRTLFRWEEVKAPIQVILKKHVIRPQYYDFSKRTRTQAAGDQGLAVNSIERKIKILRNLDWEKGFDLRGVPFRVSLGKLAPRRYEMIISNHHILYDGWSTGIILKEFFDAYNTLCTFGEPSRAAKSKFKDFVNIWKIPDNDRQQKFWASYLNGYVACMEFSSNGKINSPGRDKNESLQVELPMNFKNKLENFIKENKITLAGFFYTAFGLLMQKYNNCNDVVFGITVSGRSANLKGIEEIVGLFINTLPLRVQTSPVDTVRDLLIRINRSLQVRKEFENSTLVDIKKYGGFQSENRLFNSIVVINNYPLEKRLALDNGKLRVLTYDIFEMTHYKLTLSITIFEGIRFCFSYPSEIVDKELVSGLSRHLFNITVQMIDGFNKKIEEIDILPMDERHDILFNLNNTQTAYPENMTIHELFEKQVGISPDFTAAVDAEGVRLISYRELNKRADRLAWYLRDNEVRLNTITGLMGNRSIELIIGMMAILKAGGAFLPLDPEYPQQRIDFMLADSLAPVVLVDISLKSRIQTGAASIDLSKERHCCYKKRKLNNMSTPGDLAYVIYTSGSTGKPKGVMIVHRGLVNYVFWAAKQYVRHERGNFPFYTSISFDLTITAIFTPLISGSTVVIYNDNDKVRCIEKVVEENRIDCLKLTPTHLKLIKENQISETGTRDTMVNSNLTGLILGGEELETDLVKEISRRFKCDLAIYNEYGPTEAVVGCMIYRFNVQRDQSRTVPIGLPIDNTQIYILDRNMAPQPAGVVGELYISGAGVARGYLNQPDLTAGRFVKNPNINGKTLYRTGDLARLLYNRNIEFAGRIDRQVQIRGHRIEIGEIESQLLKHEKIREAVILARKDSNGDQYLCAYITPAVSPHCNQNGSIDDNDELDIKKFLSDILPKYMVPSYFFYLDNIPKTVNGKIDVRNLPEIGRSAIRAKFSPARNMKDSQLVQIWSELLGLAEDRIGIDANFFELGGHSLNAARLISRLHQAFGVRISFVEFFRVPTIRGVSDLLEGSSPAEYIPIPASEKREYYMASPAQRRLYVIQEMDEKNTSYNMSAAFRIEGVIDRPRLENTLKKLIDRHEILRTSFELIDGEPIQRIYPPGEIEFHLPEYYRRNKGGDFGPFLIEDCLNKDFSKPFHLNRPPLLRAGLIWIEKEISILLIDMHHIVSDGVSMGTLIDEFVKCYRETPLLPPRIQYKDYAVWLFNDHLRNRDSMDKEASFWENEFAGEIPELNIPTDYPRPRTRSFKGDTFKFEMGKVETRQLNALAVETNATQYIVLLAIFNVLLAKLSGQEDIAMGTVTEGRRHRGLESVIGMFVNTLVLRNFPAGEKRFIDFLEEVKDKLLIGFENQDYQFEDLVAAVSKKRSISRHPLFDVMFILENMEFSELKIPGLKIFPHPYKNHTSKFDISLIGTEIREKLHFKIEYSTDLFKNATISRFAGYFIFLLNVTLKEPGIRISDVEFLPYEEKNKILQEFNETYSRTPGNVTIKEIFEEQVRFCHDNIALVIDNEELTYGELNTRSNRLAWTLRSMGCGVDSVVGVMIGRTLEMIIGIMAVWKAGSTYLPVDIDYPAERIHFLLRDCAAKFLLIRKAFSCNLDFPITIINVDDLQGWNEESSNLGNLNDSRNIAYIIYTSGSTGQPKGVIVEHVSIINLVYNQKKKFQLNRKDRVLLFSSACFDASVEQILISLFSGAILLVITKDSLLDINRFENYIARHLVTHLHAVPSFLNNINLSEKYTSHLKRIISGGDVCPVDLARRLSQHGVFYNKYGPTETTVTSVEFAVDKLADLSTCLPIGKPIANTTVFILDKWLKPVPIGVTGELYIGGIGVSRGYINNPELTRAKFIANPFGGKGVLYRTGDLVRWMQGGHLEFIGRADFQVKVRGFRIELGEIEYHLRSHSHITEAVVMAEVDGCGDRCLAAYYASDIEFSIAYLKEFLFRRIPDYMVPTFFWRVKNIPLTPTGKIDRERLTGLGGNFAGEDEYEPPRNDLERGLVEIWQEVLGLDRIGIADHFFEIGGNSLKAIKLTNAVHKKFNIKLNLKDLFQASTISELCRVILTCEVNPYERVRKQPKKEYYELSHAQKRLWILYKMRPDSPAYNMSGRITFHERVDEKIIEKVLQVIVNRHDSIRTYFKGLADGPAQVVLPGYEINLEIVDLSSFSEDERNIIRKQCMLNESIMPFDLESPPLFRIKLIKCKDTEFDLLLTMHHIISDGWSMEIIKKEFTILYESSKSNEPCSLEPLKIQYRDYIAWQNQILSDKEKVRDARDFWKKQLSGIPATLNLPYDFSRNFRATHKSSQLSFVISGEVTERLRRLVNERKTSLFIILLSAFNMVLSRISGQRDIMIGVPAAAREHSDLRNVVGFFVNTLIFRNYVNQDEPLSDLLARVHRNALQILEFQGYPLEFICSELKIEYPSINVFFNMLDSPDRKQLSLDRLEPHFSAQTLDAKFDLVCYLSEYKNGIEIRFHYYKELFKLLTIKRILILYKKILENISNNTGNKIREYFESRRRLNLEPN